MAGNDTAPKLPRSCDVLVVGAGVAGASTALLLARAGLSVTVVEARPRDHRPGFALPIQRPGTVLLSQWGLLDELDRAGVPTLSRSTFCYGDRTTIVHSRPGHGVAGPIVVDQPLFDRVLRTAAQNAGARFFDAHTLEHLVRERGRVRGGVIIDAEREAVEVRADWVVGADGLASTVAHHVGAAVQREGSYASSTIAAEFEGLDALGAEWRFRNGLSGGTLGLRGGRTLAFVTASSRRYRERLRHDLTASLRNGLGELAAPLGERIESASRVGAFFGGSEHVSYARRPVGDGWILVGDAGAFIDPIVGHGLTAALRDAALTAKAITDGSPAAFAELRAVRDAMNEAISTVGERIASFRWSLDELPCLHLRLAEALREQARQLAQQQPQQHTKKDKTMNTKHINLGSFLSLALFTTLAGCAGSDDIGGDDAMMGDSDDGAASDGLGDHDDDDDAPAPGDDDDDAPTPGDDDDDDDDDAPPPGDDDDDDDDEPVPGDDDDDDLPPEAFCGDGNVDEGEVCDDGTNEGAREGDCNPTCSAVVELKHITISENATNGAFGDGTVAPVIYADAQCPAGYKAMFVDGVDRVASETPFVGDGGIDWVIAPWTEYINDNGGTVFVTGDIPLLGVSTAGEFAGLDYPIDDEVQGVWTGMRNDSTTHDANCSGWTDDDAFAFLTHGSNGLPSATDDNFAGTAQNYGRGFCAIEAPFYCVEQ